MERVDHSGASGLAGVAALGRRGAGEIQGGHGRGADSESINPAGLGYEVVFDTSPSASGVEALRALARELAKRVGLR